jgi:hypothetical protein
VSRRPPSQDTTGTYMIGAGAGVVTLVAGRVVSAVSVVKVMGVRGWSAGNVFRSVPYDADGESMLREREVRA